MTDKRIPQGADFYLFSNYIAALGSFRDEEAAGQSAIELVIGIDQPFEIQLGDKWHPGWAAAINSGTPHRIDGGGNWQFVLWVDREFGLAEILQSRALENRPWTLFNGVGGPAGGADFVGSTRRDPDPARAQILAEQLLAALGAKAVPANWDPAVREVLALINEGPGSIHTGALARKFNRDASRLDEDFRRVIGTSLGDYLHRRKWIQYIRLRREGSDRETARREAGLAGAEGLRDRFEERYGLDLKVLEGVEGLARVSEGPDADPVRFV